MKPSKEEVKGQLREGGEEYHFRNDICDIDGNRAGENRLHVGHMVVQRDKRGNGIANILLESLIEVMHEDGLSVLTMKMGATECKDGSDLKEMKEDNGQHWEDPSYMFLKKKGFGNIEYIEDWQWGLCVKGTKYV